MITQRFIDDQLNDLFLRESIIAVDGTVISADVFGTPYTTLTSGGIIKQGEPIPAFFADCCAASVAWGFFERVLLEHLNGRKRIFWRSRPTLEEQEVCEITGEIANREAVMDGLEAPRPYNHLYKRYYIRCRLTAYGA